jgi:hypothetical protein
MKDCEKPFWKDPGVIFRDFTLQYKPKCTDSKWNFGARLLIVSLFLGMIGSVAIGIQSIIAALVFGFITALIIVLTAPSFEEEEIKYEQKEQKKEKCKDDTYFELPYMAAVDPAGYLAPIKEHFVNGTGSIEPAGLFEVDAAPYSGSALPEHTPPTSRNPFMNVLLDEIKYNPTRGSAESVSNPVVKQTMDDYFRVQWFSDPTDVFGKNQSQRQFVTQPSTSVPNDQGSFANWLYKIPGKTCKEGGRNCLPGTDGGPVTWLNQDS